MSDRSPFSLADIDATAGELTPYLRETPVAAWQDEAIARRADSRVSLKLELFQHAGSFKARGALSVMLGLDSAARARGVTAVSAGNHAIAVSWAARVLGVTAKVVMPKTADPFRVDRCRGLGAEPVLVDNVHEAFAEAQRIEQEEGKSFVHPFEGPRTALGTATLGRELLRQVPDLDAVIVPIGGGGLAGGLATAIRLAKPTCEVFGVEPEQNDVMLRSLRSGQPEQAPMSGTPTIADSLSPPYTLPYSLDLCRRGLTDLVLVSDDAMRSALALLFQSAKLAVEPAGAASTAALLGPLRDRLRGKRVGLIICGTNISPSRFIEHLGRGMELLTRV